MPDDDELDVSDFENYDFDMSDFEINDDEDIEDPAEVSEESEETQIEEDVPLDTNSEESEESEIDGTTEESGEPEEKKPNRSFFDKFKKKKEESSDDESGEDTIDVETGKINPLVAILSKIPFLAPLLQPKEGAEGKKTPLPKLNSQKVKLAGLPKPIKILIIIAAVLLLILLILIVLVMGALNKKSQEDALLIEAERQRLTELGEQLEKELEEDLAWEDNLEGEMEDLPEEKPPTNVVLDLNMADSYIPELTKITQRMRRIQEPSEQATLTPRSGEIYISVLDGVENPSRVDITDGMRNAPSNIEVSTASEISETQIELPFATSLQLTDGKTLIAKFDAIINNNYQAAHDAQIKLLEALDLYYADEVRERAFSDYCEEVIRFQYMLEYSTSIDGNTNSSEYIEACRAYIVAVKSIAAKMSDYLLLRTDEVRNVMREYILEAESQRARIPEIRERYLRNEGFTDLEIAVIMQ